VALGFVLTIAALLASLVGPEHASPTVTGASAPAPAHVVVVMEENHSYGDIIGSSQAPYINQLAASGASLTQMFAITHPSEPNYLGLFSGTTHGIADDSCPHTFSGDNLGYQLREHHMTFVGYAEGLPAAGSTVCLSGEYARKHVPWVNFSDLPAAQTDLPFSEFPNDYASLPTVSFVIPDLDDDMHDGTIAQADSWLRTHLSGYATWAGTHNSLLIVTWDEDDHSADNHIPTVIVGAGVGPGQINTTVSTYSLLRLLEDTYALPHLGGAASAATIPLTR